MYERARQTLASHGRLAALVAIAAAVAVASVGLVFLARGGGSSQQQGASKSPGALSAPTGSAASEPGTRGAPAGPSAAGEPLSPKNPRLAAKWKAGHGGLALANVTQQMGTALMSHGARKYPTMKRACAELISAVAAARAAAPIPDAALQTAYRRALTTLASGAASCRAGISLRREGVEDTAVHINQTVLSHAVSELSTGATLLYRATAKIRTLKAA